VESIGPGFGVVDASLAWPSGRRAAPITPMPTKGDTAEMASRPPQPLSPMARQAAPPLVSRLEPPSPYEEPPGVLNSRTHSTRHGSRRTATSTRRPLQRARVRSRTVRNRRMVARRQSHPRRPPHALVARDDRSIFGRLADDRAPSPSRQLSPNAIPRSIGVPFNPLRVNTLGRRECRRAAAGSVR